MLYAIADQASFEHCESEWLVKAQEHGIKNIKLVGTKSGAACLERCMLV